MANITHILLLEEILMNKARKFETAFAILCVICTAVFFVSAAITADLHKNEMKNTPIDASTQAPTQEEKTPAYMLMEHEGRVYVYSGGTPFMLTDIDPVGLPGADREKLREGIGAEDRNELLGLIEDFGS